RPGILIADGAGEIRGLSEGSRGQAFSATWKKKLHLRPRDDRHVLSLYDQATVQFVGMGGFSADEIHLYLSENDSALQSTDDNQSDASDAANSRFKLRPNRLIAQGNVLVDSVWLQSKTPSSDLKVWFVPEAGIITDHDPNDPSSNPTASGSSANPSS